MSNTFQFADLLAKDEPLNPILRPYLYEATFGPALNHPLVQQIPYNPMMNALINKSYEIKMAKVEEAVAAKKWSTAIFLHERPYRLDALAKYARQMDDKSYWDMVGNAWTDSENIWQNLSRWRDLWEAKRPDKDLVMTEDERDVLASLPDTIPVYRGVHGQGAKKRVHNGMSWTIDRDKAVWFAERWKKPNPMVLEGRVKKKDVHAYFAGRGETEIVSSSVKIVNP